MLHVSELTDYRAPVLLCIIGTRPEITKTIGSIRQLRSTPSSLDVRVALSGQQPDLRGPTDRDLQLDPDYVLPNITNTRNLAGLTSSLMTQITGSIEDCDPDFVAVQGDTATALAGAMAAALARIPLIHIEAGVRSSIPNEPFPEDLNRRLISATATHHLCFDLEAEQNLLQEGIDKRFIYSAQHPADQYISATLGSEFRVPVKPLIVFTFHRRERRLARQKALVGLVVKVARAFPTVELVFVEHPGVDWSPYRSALLAAKIGVSSAIPPKQFLRLLASAACVVSDSAGVIEEASRMGVPSVSFRNAKENRSNGPAPLLFSEEPSEVLSQLQTWLSQVPDTRVWHRTTSSRPDIAGRIRQIVESG